MLCSLYVSPHHLLKPESGITILQILEHAQRGTMMDQVHTVPEQRTRAHRLLTPKHHKSRQLKQHTLAPGDLVKEHTMQDSCHSGGLAG